jgi:hypothetical protein
MKPMKKTILMMLAIFAMRISAQSLPNAPKPRLDKTEWALLASDAAVRGVDVYSTHWAEAAGNKERCLPGFIANHTPVMALYSGGVVYSQYRIAKKLTNHHHQKWAHAISAVDIAVTAPSAIHNFYLPVCVAPAVYTSTGCQQPGQPQALFPR